MDEKLVESVVRAASAALGKGSFAKVDEGRSVFKDPDSSATALYIAARRLLGSDFPTWEPETLWLEVDVPLCNRDKLLAAIALDRYPAFYWDPRVLGSTALALNHEVVFTGAMPHTTPEHLAWAVFEAGLIFALADDGKTSPEFDDEAAAYVGAMLYDAGYAFCPEPLDFADEHLVRLLSKDGQELHAKVKGAKEPPKAEPSEEDSALGVQLKRRAAVDAYVTHRLEALHSELSR